MTDKKINVARNFIVLIVVSVIVLFFALKDDLFEKIQYLFSFNIWWFFLALIFVLIYFLLKSVVIYLIIKKFDSNYKYKKALKLYMATQFFNAVTPFSTGGQPFQIYSLKKHGYEIEKGTNVVIQDSIVYQIALILLGTIAIITNHLLDLFPHDNFLKHLVMIGYAINVGVIVVLFIAAFNKKGNKFLLNLAIKIGAKLKIIKDKQKFLDRSNEIISHFNQNANTLMKSKVHFIQIIIINFIALTCLYLVPFALIMGLGETINPFIAVVTSAYVMLIGSFVPIPGGSGGLEYSFIKFFGIFVVGAKLSSIMIVWRMLTYYLGMFLGAIFLSVKEE